LFWIISVNCMCLCVHQGSYLIPHPAAEVANCAELGTLCQGREPPASAVFLPLTCCFDYCNWHCFDLYLNFHLETQKPAKQKNFWMCFSCVGAQCIQCGERMYSHTGWQYFHKAVSFLNVSDCMLLNRIDFIFFYFLLRILQRSSINIDILLWRSICIYKTKGKLNWIFR
jgi:hypothetical protein